MNQHFSTEKYTTAILLVSLWLIGTVYAFWYFHFRYIYSVNSVDQWVMFSSDLLNLENAHTAGSPTLIHFHDPSCPCSRFIVSDVKKIVDSFADQIQVRVLVPDDQAVVQVSRTFGVRAEVAPNQMVPAASPAAWLMSANGQTAYLGPYSDSGTCTSSETHKVSTLIEDLLAGKTLTATNHLTTGCFCQWPSTGQTFDRIIYEQE